MAAATKSPLGGSMVCVKCSSDVHRKNHRYVVLASSDVLHLRCYESGYPTRPTRLGGAVHEGSDSYGGFWG